MAGQAPEEAAAFGGTNPADLVHKISADLHDIARVKSNVADMVRQGAPESDIDAYIKSENVSVNAIRELDQKSVGKYIDDIGRSLALGATFGFADKMAAGLDTLTRGGTYEENLKKQRAQSEAVPGAIKIPGEIAGTVAGSIAAAPATGAAAAITGAAKLPAIVRAVGSGAGVGALQAAGESDNVTPGEVATGAGIGAATAGILQPVISGLKAVAAPIIGTIRGAINPADEAARRVGSAIKKDSASGGAGLTPTEFSDAATGGAPVAVADMGGKVTGSLARSAANTSPEARATLENFANDRFEGQTDRAATFVRGLIGAKGDVGAMNEEIQNAARKANAPAYGAAYAAGDKPVWSPVLERLSASPTIQGAMRGAERKWADWQAIDGFGAMNPPARVGDGGILKFGGGGLKTFPNIQYWDYVARDLAGKAQSAADAGNMQEAARFGGLERLLKSELDKLVPEFNAARVGAAGFFGAENALEAGQNFLSKSVDLNDAARVVAKMPEQERNLFKFGFAGALLSKISQIPDRADITKRIADSPDARQRISVALGDDGASKLGTFLNVESVMSKLKDSVTNNSSTARQLVELGLAGGALGYGEYTNDPRAMTKAALVYGLARGQRAIDQRIVNKVADLLVSNDPSALLKGIEMVNANKQLGDAFGRLVSRVATQQSTEYVAPALGGITPQSAQPGLARQ